MWSAVVFAGIATGAQLDTTVSDVRAICEAPSACTACAAATIDSPLWARATDHTPSREARACLEDVLHGVDFLKPRLQPLEHAIPLTFQ